MLLALLLHINMCYSVAVAMRAVRVREFGGPEVLTVVQDAPLPDVAPDYVLIRVHATALNRLDAILRSGNSLAFPADGSYLIPGVECSGEIHKVGLGAEREFEVGDRVMALVSGGGYAEYVAAPKRQVMKVPDALNLTHAAGIPEAWLTAYQLLFFVSKFVSGDTVLVHAAGSGVGTAAIQLVRANGGKAIAVAGSDVKLAKAKELGADVVINYKVADFSEEIKVVTKGRGVDVILDCVGAEYWKKNMAALAVDGRWVVYGLLGGGHIEGDFFRQLIMKRGSLLTSLLKPRSDEYKAELVREFADKCLPKFATKELWPVIDSVFGIERISEAHARMEANLNLGKILVRISHEDSGKDEL